MLDFSKVKLRDPDELALALARIEAHTAFDWLWKDGPYSRSGAYAWLAGVLGKTAAECHIKQFDAATCAEVVRLSVDLRFKQLVGTEVRTMLREINDFRRDC